jgi:hypothetical protein
MASIRTDGTAAADFLGLIDTPDRFAGHALRLLSVNADEDALEAFEIAGPGAETFLDLTDTPGS